MEQLNYEKAKKLATYYTTYFKNNPIENYPVALVRIDKQEGNNKITIVVATDCPNEYDDYDLPTFCNRIGLTYPPSN